METKHEARKENEEYDFHVFDKIFKPAFLNRDDGKHIRQQRLHNSRSKKIVYSVSEYFLKNKEDSRTPYLERTAEATCVSRATV